MANASVLSEKKLPLWNNILIGHDVVNRYFPPILPSKSELIDLLFFSAWRGTQRRIDVWKNFALWGEYVKPKSIYTYD